jgi:protein-S-isoprenylcysteine O-methyltransferase Ste14
LTPIRLYKYSIIAFTLKGSLSLKPNFLAIRSALSNPIPSISYINWYGFFSIIAIVSLMLLIYSVFIEVGRKTYKVENEHSLVTSGTYALTRHPGVLWMLLLYIFGAIFFQNLLAIYAALIWTLANIIYVTIQERFIFHKIFDNYDKYRETTPMILPNFQSIEKFITTKNWRST